MLRHKGVKRNFRHNLMLATLFAFVAGMVNVTGLILLHVFTTNITGHIGTLALSFDTGDFRDVAGILLWILCFFSGAFFASLLTGYLYRHSPRLSYAIPVSIEIIVLLITDLLFPHIAVVAGVPDIRVLLLFFAMGLQNGIVSVVSGNVVRTTHLTGMITDLGIGLGELAVGKNTVTVRKKILLSGAIILSFLCGGIASGLFTTAIGRHILLAPVAILFFVLCFDYVKLQYIVLVRKIKAGHTT